MNSQPTHRSYLIGALLTIVLMVIIGARPNEQNSLEARVADLERRVALLEGQKGTVSASRPAQSSSNRGFENIENWRRLKTGMTPSQVRAILGEPRRISGGYVTTWNYDSDITHSDVTFVGDKLSSWKEPD
jgi:HD superfamily phosphodiesterase